MKILILITLVAVSYAFPQHAITFINHQPEPRPAYISSHSSDTESSLSTVVASVPAELTENEPVRNTPDVEVVRNTQENEPVRNIPEVEVLRNTQENEPVRNIPEVEVLRNTQENEPVRNIPEVEVVRNTQENESVRNTPEVDAAIAEFNKAYQAALVATGNAPGPRVNIIYSNTNPANFNHQ